MAALAPYSPPTTHRSPLTTHHSSRRPLVTPAQYPTIVKDLLVQAFIKIEESDLQVCCRAEDVAIVQGAIAKAVTAYQQKTNKQVSQVVY